MTAIEKAYFLAREYELLRIDIGIIVGICIDGRMSAHEAAERIAERIKIYEVNRDDIINKW